MWDMNSECCEIWRDYIGRCELRHPVQEDETESLKSHETETWQRKFLCFSRNIVPADCIAPLVDTVRLTVNAVMTRMGSYYARDRPLRV